jgi:hypothetical protein
MTNSNYDTCIFYKNPFVQTYSLTGQTMPAALTRINSSNATGTDLSSVQTFGVKLKNRISDQYGLRSRSFYLLPDDVVVSGGSIQSESNPYLALGTRPKFSYASDTHSITALATSYFWLNEMEARLKMTTGTFYASNRDIAILQLSNIDGSITNVPSRMRGNAFWTFSYDSTSSSYIDYVVSGLFTDGNSFSNGRYFEGTLNGEVVLHEMGHANFAYANGSLDTNIFNDSNSGYCSATNHNLCCNSNIGCQRAINEGQADFHYLMMFPDYPTILEAESNSLLGSIANRNMNHIIDNNYGITTIGSLEIHNLGAVFAATLYAIYINPNTNKRLFEKTFMELLKVVVASDTFADILDHLLSIDSVLSGNPSAAGLNSEIITTEFNNRGIH